MEDLQKCSHATCSCAALPMMDYCGEACREAAALEAMRRRTDGRECRCGHADCGGQTEVSGETEGMLIPSEKAPAAKR